jgi:tRNA dimethylallyltransferase
MSSIGYRELLAVTKDEMVLNDALKLIQQKTRNYAKRQLTWFKRNQAIHWIKDVQEAYKLVSEWIS